MSTNILTNPQAQPNLGSLAQGGVYYPIHNTVTTSSTTVPVWIQPTTGVMVPGLGQTTFPRHPLQQAVYTPPLHVKVGDHLYIIEPGQPGQTLLIEDGPPRWVYPHELSPPKQLSPPMFSLEELQDYLE